MTLSKEAIQEFKELFKKRFDKEISDQEAFDRGMRLLNMYKVVYGVRSKKTDILKKDDALSNE